ncbi:hypothetical protein GOB94_08485 [Granulicella sp. 5B5]|uniref:hypothetical protein n=1 Tax=Granulicella sp. 5B5 TaxID=1617967 RepID=UPI0015F6B31F|nr:hypothetical protein [Granulicella sp. 5B5]QMV18713.1 hypothetical protein GOB94_08485 [Granulicella sp. 5B5]
MAANRQLEDLCALYAERSEPELLALYEQHEDLTDLAQQALQQVMHERGIAAPQPAAAQPELPAEDPTGSAALAADEICIFTFSDAFQLGEALRILQRQEVLCRTINWDEVSPRDDGGPMRLGLIVKRADAAKAKQALQQAMNLYPAAKGAEPFEALADFAQVGIFLRDDALLVAHALGAAGVSYVWNDSRDDDTMGEDEVILEVRPQLLDEAHQIAQQALTD